MPRSFRLPDDVDAVLGALAARTGQSVTDVVVTAIRAHGDTLDLEADLIDRLGHDFIAATLLVGRNEQGEPTVEVLDVEPRITGPRAGEQRSATTEPFEQYVGVEARAGGPGRATVELVGLPGTDLAGVRVWVATLPLVESAPPAGTGTREGPTVTVQLSELHPLSRSA